MLENLKSWLGAEPFLGIITLAVTLPIAGVLAYMIFESAISAPIASAILIGIAGAAFLIDYAARRLNEKWGRRLENSAPSIMWIGFTAWTFRDEFIPWPGFTPGMIAKLLGVALWLFVIVMIIKRNQGSGEPLRNYHQD